MGEGAAWHRGSVRASQPSVAGLTQPKTKNDFLFIGMLFSESFHLLTAPKFLGSNFLRDTILRLQNWSKEVFCSPLSTWLKSQGWQVKKVH